MGAIRRWFIHHWFGGVFLIIGAIWLATTIAYNRITGERVMVEASASVSDQALALTSRGLSAADPARLSLESIADFPTVSMQREGGRLVAAAEKPQQFDCAWESRLVLLRSPISGRASGRKLDIQSLGHLVSQFNDAV